MFVLIFFTHRENIKRLKNKEETKTKIYQFDYLTLLGSLSFMNLVIVESPAKAKTINKYLGDNYKVLASYGHIRDLPSKNGSVDPD